MEKGSSSTAYGSGDSLNGLKFGKKIYFEDAGGSGSSSAKSMPAKKGKGTLSSSAPAGQKAPRCQVEGCNLDLTGVKPYYCRHKVCGMHSKSPRVIVAGLEQRFCQQCSRFHLLSEFDQGKRSCRRRLAGHNERRRKPPPGPLTSRYGRLSSFHEDNKYRSFLMDFSYPRPTPGASSRDASWPSNNQWHGPAAAFDARVGMTMTNHYATNDTIFPVAEQAPGDCLGGVSDSNCALSLLSTQPWGSAAIAAAAPHRNHGPSLMAQLNMANTCMNNNNSNSNNNTSSWAFRDSSALGMGGLRRLTDAGTNGHFSSELGLALQGNSRQCPDDLSHHEVYGNDQSLMHWSL